MNANKELVEALKQVRKDFEMLASGEWDASTEEGKESANDSIDLIDEALKKAGVSQ